MSADKWVECPVCNGLPERLRGGYKHLYGTIPEQEYMKIKNEYECDRVGTPVRIDYECTLKADGTLFLVFFAQCRVCGAKWEHQGVVK